MYQSRYLMEDDDESLRLDLKTDQKTIERQALWAGLRPNMRVADIGCGSGKTTFCLQQLIQPQGTATGIDFSDKRITFASKHYSGKGINFISRDICKPLDDLGQFDFIWVRFILEYFRTQSFEIVKNISNILKPGGILCLIDLDYNCLNHFGLSLKLEKSILGIIQMLEKHADFDPYVGRKLYSYLYDLDYQNIDVDMTPHHLIFGELGFVDAFNWTKKVEIAAQKSGYQFSEYRGGYDEFFEDFKQSFADHRRFTYTPVFACKGNKPL